MESKAMKRIKLIILAGTVVVLAAGAGALWMSRQKIARHFTIAKAEALVDKGVVTIPDLTGRFAIPAGSLDNITGNPQWSAVPRDFQSFHNVPFQIDGMLCLWGASNAKQGYVLPEQALDVGIKGKFETLYLYHATFYASPAGTPVYEVVFRYEDGSAVTNQILYGEDVFDWYGGAGLPSNPRSRVAWRGQYTSGAKTQKLSFYLTALQNPYPATLVTAVDLYSSKNDSAACIGALTAGPAGLARK
jgi:hypothetical protein